MKQVVSNMKQETSNRKRLLSPVSFLLSLVSLFLIPAAFAGTLTFIRDTIGTSASSLPATHEIMFIVANAIPPGGKIVVTPESGVFIIPAALNFLDADLSVATSSIYIDRPLAGNPSATDDGVAVVSGTSGNVTFTLSSGTGINAGEKVKIEIGNNATFGGTGVNFIINPAPVGSYTIGVRTEDAFGARIDSGAAMIAVIAQVTAGPVNTTIANPPFLSNGLPTGLLPSGITAVELSVQTDVPATCKYSSLPDVPFASSTGAFPQTGGTVHSGAVVTSLSDGFTYNYYVRCRNYQLLVNTTDYVISFSIGIVPSTAPPTPPAPPPAPSRGGVPGGGDFLKTSGVTISGKAYPSAKVSILKDGKEAASAVAASDGTWKANLTGLERGTYTLGVYAVDSKSRRSATISSTISVIADTGNALTRIFLAPTLSAEKTSVDPGQSFVISGQGAPKSVTEILLSRQDKNGEPRTATTTTDANGLWSADFDTKGLSVGGYEVRARSLFSDGDSSGFSGALSLGLGQDASPDFVARSDMNNDGKINLVDFSILLFSWGTDDPATDINGNGKVDLADFSILIFHWTG
jgi:hypothetical protein